MIMVHECNDIANDVLNNKKTVNAYNQFLKLHHAYYGLWSNKKKVFHLEARGNPSANEPN